MKVKNFITVSILVVIIGLGLGYLIYGGYWDVWRYRGLLSNVPEEDSQSRNISTPEGIDTTVAFDTESGERYYETSVASTGELREFALRNFYSGGDLGRATALKVIGRDSAGNPKVFEIVLQIISTSDSQNFIAWLVRRSAEQVGLTSAMPDGKVLTFDELSQIYSQGSTWEIFPLINYGADGGKFAEVFGDYVFTARQYYGDDLPIVQNYFANGLTGKSYRQPVLAISIDKL